MCRDIRTICKGKVSVGDQGLVNEVNCRWEYIVFLARSFGPDGPQSLKQLVSRVGGVNCYLSCSPLSPGGMQFLKRRKIAPNHPLCRTNDALQPALVPDGGSRLPDGDGGGKDGLNDGGVELHHNSLWKPELLQLPQEVHSLLCLLW
ncbi:hypothetical protein AMECASPLE_020825 [Ameca splendens]|uniref:Uncharacterized protein n=1 Tax=Ameca splendens TaxID=208324 RepID=A0ABV0ZZN7_9TELE